MSILKEVLLWSEKDFSPWLKDAARRLLLNERLDAQDYRDLYTLMKRDKGLEVDSELQAIPLSIDHIPVDGDAAHSVILKSMGNMENVNKISSPNPLTFCEKGLSIIYGGNGAGKSGYARVLKHACRARDRGAAILHDVTREGNSGLPQAKFIALVNGKDIEFNWSSGSVPAAELSGISVFDTSCASAYLIEGEAAYLPRGLDIIEDLANKVLPEVSRLLANEMDGIDISQDLIKGFDVSKPIGQALRNFGDKTDRKKLVELGVLSEDEKARIEALELAVAEPDPILRYQALKNSASHIKNLAKTIQDKERYTTKKALDKLKSLVEEASKAQLGVEAAAKALRAEDVLLPGTGENVWKELFLSARKYATKVAYAGAEFPGDSDDAICVLCQQPLDAALERMQRFDKFINENATKVATEKQDVLEKALDTIERSSLDFGLNDAHFVELEGASDALVQSLRVYQSYLDGYQAWMLGAAKKQDWSDMPELLDSPVVALRSVAALKLWTARVYKKASDPDRVKLLASELDDLKDRQRFSQILKSVLDLLDRLSIHSKLNGCKADLNPRSLSAKSKEIAGKVITETLRKALDDEFKKLGVGHIKTKLKDRVDRGSVKFTLLLDLPAARKIEQVLSEGEQRAIALGAFLAELKIANHGGGIIFDDPVSSLDHVRRRKVAHRLVEEAALRQVIVLTHDISFLSELIDTVNADENLAHVVHHLEWVGDGAGHVKKGLPWDKAGYKERVKLLEAKAKLLAPWPIYPSDDLVSQVRQIYSDIRATVEKVVEDVVLNGVVTRFSDMVGVGNLHKITGLRKQDADDIVDLWKKCHRITGAHHQPVNKDAPVPDLDEINTDIQSILSLATNVTAHRAKPTGN
ncbi:hypothetical protein DZC75_18675 [Pseudomonas parafulva]|uniref:Protein CR006 P-loop domain-containing protein n=1 Tax=Pseudomonas parafulva TaxID=157782 RepID=A0AAI8KBQ9_9PSED|nr:AAA family ATPase [Pseudomonas parafulva]AXO89929.1 hypothetical protein DZC75_18675 [Pseudomonas parafulva]